MAKTEDNSQADLVAQMFMELEVPIVGPHTLDIFAHVESNSHQYYR